MRNIWTDETTLAITCGRGIMPYLKQELTEMGYEILGSEDTMVGIRSKTPARDIFRLNLCLRTAQRVLWPFVQDTRCRDLDALYRLAVNAPWEQLLSPDHSFYVTSVVKNDTIIDTRMPTLKLKDGIVDRLRAKCGRRPCVGDSVNVHVVADGKELLNQFVPLHNALRVLRSTLGDWLESLPQDQEYAEMEVTVDQEDLMSGKVPVSKIDFQTLTKRFDKTFEWRLAEGPVGAAVFLYWEGTHAKVYIDTTGNTLSRRGYRKEGWKAPMQEALAAACVMATGWDKKSPFIVPFSGSGTPAIEAALMARNIAPGQFRSNFAFMFLQGWTNIIPGEKAGESVRKRFGAMPQEIWRDMVSKARQAELPNDDPSLPQILGVDIEEEAVQIAERNAAVARVAVNIKFMERDFKDTPLPATPGIIFMNPPYGERLEDDETLEPLYEGIGTWLKDKVPAGWTAWMITASKPLSLKVNLQTSKILPFMNGALDCRFLSYEVR